MGVEGREGGCSYPHMDSSSQFSVLSLKSFSIRVDEKKQKNKKSKRSGDSHSSAKLKTHASHTKHAVLDHLNVYSNRAPIIHGGQKSKNNFQHIILTYR